MIFIYVFLYNVTMLKRGRMRVRFCDFFLEYKLKVLSLDSRIPWKELAMYKKVGLALTIIFMIFSIITFFFQWSMGMLWIYVIDNMSSYYCRFSE